MTAESLQQAIGVVVTDVGAIQGGKRQLLLFAANLVADDYWQVLQFQAGIGADGLGVGQGVFQFADLVRPRVCEQGPIGSWRQLRASAAAPGDTGQEGVAQREDVLGTLAQGGEWRS